MRPTFTPPAAVIAVHVIDFEFYREKDMKRFSQRELFVEESGKITDHGRFKTHPLYSTIMTHLTELDTIQSQSRTNN